MKNKGEISERAIIMIGVVVMMSVFAITDAIKCNHEAEKETISCAK